MISYPRYAVSFDDRAYTGSGFIIRDPDKAEIQSVLGIGEMVIVGDEKKYSEENDNVKIEGNAYILTQEDFISADSIDYNKKEGIAYAKGNVKIRSFESDSIVFGDEAVFYTENKNIKITGNARSYINKEDIRIIADEFYRDKIKQEIRASGNVYVKRLFDEVIIDADEFIFDLKRNTINISGKGNDRPGFFYGKNEYIANEMEIFLDDERILMKGNSEVNFNSFRFAYADSIDFYRNYKENDSLCDERITSYAILKGNNQNPARIVEKSIKTSLLEGEDYRIAEADKIFYYANERCEKINMDQNSRFSMKRIIKDDSVSGDNLNIKYRKENIESFSDKIVYIKDLKDENGDSHIDIEGKALFVMPSMIGAGDKIRVKPSHDAVDAILTGNASIYQGFSLEETIKRIEDGQETVPRVNRRMHGHTIRFFEEDNDHDKRQRLIVTADIKNGIYARIVEETQEIRGAQIDYYAPVKGHNPHSRSIYDGERVEIVGDNERGVKAEFSRKGKNEQEEDKGEADRIDFFGRFPGTAILTKNARFIRKSSRQEAEAEKIYVFGFSASEKQSALKKSHFQAILFGNARIVDKSDPNAIRNIGGHTISTTHAEEGFSFSIIGDSFIKEDLGNEIHADFIRFTETKESKSRVAFINGNVKIRIAQSGEFRDIHAEDGVYREFPLSLKDNSLSKTSATEVILNRNIIYKSDDGMKMEGGEFLRFYRQNVDNNIYEKMVLFGDSYKDDNDLNLDKDSYNDNNGKLYADKNEDSVNELSLSGKEDIAFYDLKIDPSLIDRRGKIITSENITNDNVKYVRTVISDIIEYTRNFNKEDDTREQEFNFYPSLVDSYIHVIEEKEKGEISLISQSKELTIKLSEEENGLKNSIFSLIGDAKLDTKEDFDGISDMFIWGERITYSNNDLEDDYRTITIEGSDVFEKNEAESSVVEEDLQEKDGEVRDELTISDLENIESKESKREEFVSDLENIESKESKREEFVSDLENIESKESKREEFVSDLGNAENKESKREEFVSDLGNIENKESKVEVFLPDTGDINKEIDEILEPISESESISKDSSLIEDYESTSLEIEKDIWISVPRIGKKIPFYGTLNNKDGNLNRYIGEPETCKNRKTYAFITGKQGIKSSILPIKVDKALNAMDTFYKKIEDEKVSPEDSFFSIKKIVNEKREEAKENHDFDFYDPYTYLFPSGLLPDTYKKESKNIYYWIASSTETDINKFYKLIKDDKKENILDNSDTFAYSDDRYLWFCAEEIKIIINDKDDNDQLKILSFGDVYMYDVSDRSDTFREIKGNSVGILNMSELLGDDKEEKSKQDRIAIYSGKDRKGNDISASILSLDSRIKSTAILYQNTDYKKEINKSSYLFELMSKRESNDESENDYKKIFNELKSSLLGIKAVAKAFKLNRLPSLEIESFSYDEPFQFKAVKNYLRQARREMTFIELQSPGETFSTFESLSNHVRIESPYVYFSLSSSFLLSQRYPQESANIPAISLLNADNTQEDFSARAELIRFWVSQGLGLASGDVFIAQDPDNDGKNNTELVANRAIFDRSKNEVRLDGDVVVLSEGNSTRPRWALFNVGSKEVYMGGGPGGLEVGNLPDQEESGSALSGFSDLTSGGSGFSPGLGAIKNIKDTFNDGSKK